jgi:hypothetical protein
MWPKWHLPPEGGVHRAGLCLLDPRHDRLSVGLGLAAYGLLGSPCSWGASAGGERWAQARLPIIHPKMGSRMELQRALAR